MWDILGILKILVYVEYLEDFIILSIWILTTIFWQMQIFKFFPKIRPSILLTIKIIWYRGQAKKS